MKRWKQVSRRPVCWLLTALAVAMWSLVPASFAELVMLQPKPDQVLSTAPKTLKMQWEYRQDSRSALLPSSYVLTLQRVNASGQPAGDPVVVVDGKLTTQAEVDAKKLSAQGKQWQWVLVARARVPFSGHVQLGRLTGTLNFAAAK